MSNRNELTSKKMVTTLPLLPLKDIVIFPHMIVPVFANEHQCIGAVDAASHSHKKIFLSAFKVGDDDLESSLPPPFDVYDVGLICSIIRTRKLPDGRTKILVQGINKARVQRLVQSEPFPIVELASVTEQLVYQTSAEIEALIRAVRDNLEKVVSLGKTLPPDMAMVLEDVNEPGRLSDLVAANLGLKVREAQQILVINNPVERLRYVYNLLSREIEVFRMQVKIQSQARERLGKDQKNIYIREQIKVLQDELGDSSYKDDVADLWQQLEEVNLSATAREEVVRNLRRLEKMHQDTGEASSTRTYIEQVLSLPWQIFTDDNLDLKKVKLVLDNDHFGLSAVKDRIIEYLAVKKLNPNATSPILCFVGPPGVGKTSLGRSIAKAIGRKFARVSLGGVRDEADIRGHRKTYIGAYPGRIIQCLKQAKSSNPIIMLDEIDKIGADHRGDPAAALLEALDPEQNVAFIDHYLGVEFDLSRVLFIANANTITTVPHALRDRLEIIEISGYSLEEKMAIANQFLIPKQLREAGLQNSVQVNFNRGSIAKIINGYSRESGLRALEKKIASICRKIARQVVENVTAKKSLKITPRQVEKQLGPGYIDNFSYNELQSGVALALAYTPFGGNILAIETNILRNKQARLKLTGQLGEVMNESAHAALSFVVSNAAFFGFDADILTANEIHIHVPAGATPKDGPSAGVSIASSILSAVLAVPPAQAIAMTGEISLHGRIFAVGGLKEKFLAAQRHGLRAVIVPKQNQPAVAELGNDVKKNLKIHYIDDYFSAFQLLFANGLVISNSEVRATVPA